MELSSSLYQLLPGPENRVGTRKPGSEHSRNIDEAGKQTDGTLDGTEWTTGEQTSGAVRDFDGTLRHGDEKTRAGREDSSQRLSRVSGAGRTGLSGKIENENDLEFID